MREAARRTGCTHQAPYHYFPNREAILAALVTEGFEELANRLSAAHDGLEARGLTATLETSANAYIEFALRNPGVFRIMFRPDMCDPENFPEVRRAGERARGELTRLAQMVQGGGSTPEVEALFWAGVHGLASLLLDGPLAAELKTLGERLDFARRVTAAGIACSGSVESVHRIVGGGGGPPRPRGAAACLAGHWGLLIIGSRIVL